MTLAAPSPIESRFAQFGSILFTLPQTVMIFILPIGIPVLIGWISDIDPFKPALSGKAAVIDSVLSLRFSIRIFPSLKKKRSLGSAV